MSLLVLSPLYSQTNARLLQAEVNVVYLSSDLLEGRGTGTRGEEKAAHYIASEFDALGLEPIGEKGYFRPFMMPYSSDPHGATADTVRGINVAAQIIHNPSNKTIILGGHYDHLGYGEGHGGSRHVGDRAIHNGADDNASGIALMLDIANTLRTSEYQDFNYLFVAFSGEEMGLLGSKYFADHPGIDMESVLCMLNFDMVGRLNEEKKFMISGTGTSPFWQDALESINLHNLSFNASESGLGPSDHTSFYLKDIPVLHFFTGQHQEYHKPSDDSHLVNYQGILDLSDFVRALIDQMKEDKSAITFSKSKDPAPRASSSFKVTLGIMPDYVSDGSGLRVDAVMDGRPAQKAGLKSGDVIIKMDDLEVSDIYDYMQGLGNYEAGQSCTVVVKRGEEVLEYEVTF